MKISHAQLVKLNACEMGLIRFEQQVKDLGLAPDAKVDVAELINGANTYGDFAWLLVNTVPYHKIMGTLHRLLTAAIEAHEESTGILLPQIVFDVQDAALKFSHLPNPNAKELADLARVSSDLNGLYPRPAFIAAKSVARFASLTENDYKGFRVAAVTGAMYGASAAIEKVSKIKAVMLITIELKKVFK